MPFWVLRMKDHFPKLSLKGIEKNGDSEVYVIEATPAEGRTRILFFDVAPGPAHPRRQDHVCRLPRRRRR